LLPVTAGMQASVDIQTGTRSVMSYLISPLMRARADALRER
jgi:multidrug efflux pump subunit AcrA (membrane-fusion protein)